MTEPSLFQNDYVCLTENAKPALLQGCVAASVKERASVCVREREREGGNGGGGRGGGGRGTAVLDPLYGFNSNEIPSRSQTLAAAQSLASQTKHKMEGNATRVRAIRVLPASGGRWWCRHRAGLCRSNPSAQKNRCPAHHHSFRACTASHQLSLIPPSCLTSRGRTRACDPAWRKVSSKPLSRRTNTQPQQRLI